MFYSDPPTPGELTRTAATTDSLTVAWSEPDQGTFGFYVLYVNDRENTRV